MSMRKHRPRYRNVDERAWVHRESNPHPPTPLKVLDLEVGLPSVPEARTRLGLLLEACRREGRRFLKIVHGYGSTGEGGRLREALRGTLFQRKLEGAIRDFIPGEVFHDFHPATAELIRRCPVLARDYDFDRPNKGVTIVILK